jgi:hypothetical protein
MYHRIVVQILTDVSEDLNWTHCQCDETSPWWLRSKQFYQVDCDVFWRRVALQVLNNVSEEHIASFFRVNSLTPIPSKPRRHNRRLCDCEMHKCQVAAFHYVYCYVWLSIAHVRFLWCKYIYCLSFRMLHIPVISLRPKYCVTSHLYIWLHCRQNRGTLIKWQHASKSFTIDLCVDVSYYARWPSGNPVYLSHMKQDLVRILCYYINKIFSISTLFFTKTHRQHSLLLI